MTEWTIEPGTITARSAVAAIYGGATQGGIQPSSRTRNILIYSDPVAGSAHGYNFDGFARDGAYYYTGEGQAGDQKVHSGNLAVLKQPRQRPTPPAASYMRGLLVAVVWAATSTGCATGPQEDGPLATGDPTSRGRVCIPSEFGRPITVGMDTATNTGDENLLVDGIELSNPKGLEVVYSSMREIDGNLIGAQTAFPPENAPELSADADGDEWLIEPGEKLNVLIAVEPTASVGTADAIQISYQTPDGDKYVATTTTSIVVPNNTSTTCDDLS
ncbi:MAG TPA: hypothetical protein VIP77_08015 [Jiangellaceae bacterium]